MMKLNLKILLLLASLLAASLISGQSVPEKAARLDSGKFIIRIDLSWTEAQQQMLSELYDLDSLLIANIFDKNLTTINDSTEWKAALVKPGIIEISKDLNRKADAWDSKIILSEMVSASKIPPANYPAPPPFGVNEFSNSDVFTYTNGTACFRLPGNRNARSVLLSGSFNNWSTMLLPLRNDGSGWSVCIELPPGKHLYKFIVDGRWISDPNNKLREPDGHYGNNSVVYCYNYTFTLQGFQKADRVILAGSFNGWNTRNPRMVKTSAGWELPVFINEGTHTYKYIVDGRWITDPDNPMVRPDGRGNENSVLELGEPYIFRLRRYADAREVILTGNFNGWNTSELKMLKFGDEWRLPYVLAAGNYEYKFIVDGRWITDPNNPFMTGSGEVTNSFLAVNPTHLFELKGAQNAERVIVTGSFNWWRTQDYRMVLRGNEWVFPIHLYPGRYSYKFIVDGEWILDPANPLWEDNEYGNGNSVLWIGLKN